MLSHVTHWEFTAMAGHSTEIHSPYVQQIGCLATMNQASEAIRRHVVEYIIGHSLTNIIVPQISRSTWYLLHFCIPKYATQSIPYSGKFSREKIFANFADRLPLAKYSSQRFLLYYIALVFRKFRAIQ